MKIALLIIIALLIFFPFFRCVVFNLHRVYFYGIRDIIDYFKDRKWEKFNRYGIDMFIGMFGHGKTLSMTHEARLIYKQFGDSIRFFSNYELKGIPYIPLINFNQLVDLGEETDSKYQANVVLIDEIENLLQSRNFASFPLALMHMLTQQRKKRVYILCSAQRFFMVDKLWRSITTHVYDCNKRWRFQNMQVYDAWDYENAMNPKLLQSLGNIWWFVKDADYKSYDTSEMIMKGSAENFISNEEAIVRKGLDSSVNEAAIRRPNKKLNRSRQKSQRS